MAQYIKFNENEKKFLMEHYLNKGRKYCSEYLGYSCSKIGYEAGKLGLKVSSNTLSENIIKRRSEESSKCKVDISLFMENFTKESVYLLGFLWADGYLMNTGLVKNILCEINREDFHNIEYIFDSCGHWTKTYREREGRKPQARIQTCSARLFEFLEKYNYTIKSGAAPTILNVIPEELKFYWYLGVIDGDGCFYYQEKGVKQFSLASTYDQNWDFMEKICNNLDCKYSINKRINKLGHSSSHFRICKMAHIKKLGEYIYQDDNFIPLKRKYEKYLLIKNHILKYQ